MILTIGMIVKNEEKYLDRCLSSIKPILENVDSELIITDTGSTDRTVEIAKKYTDKIIYFEWINDFAAARNTAFEKAQGEWFMFVDADEVFRSCDGIIDFFRSGKFKNYNSATYVYSNFTNDRDTITTYNIQRLTKILPETRFEGIIHEYLNTFGDPIYRTKDIADHYGYINSIDDKDKLRRKSQRNVELLLKKFNSEKEHHPLIYAQLYDSYIIMEDEESTRKAYEYLELGIEECKKSPNLGLAILYTKKAYALASEDRYTEAAAVCRDYFGLDRSIRKDGLTSDKEMYAVFAISLLRAGDKSEAETAFANYFKTCEAVESGKIDTADADAVNFRASADYNYIPFVCAYINCGLANGHEHNAAETVAELPVYKYSGNSQAVDDLIDMELKLLEKVDEEYISKFLEKLDDYGRKKLKEKAVKLTVSGKQSPSDEMRKLAAMLKANIRNLIDNGHKAEAEKYLDEYSKLVPDDKDIPILRGLIKECYLNEWLNYICCKT